jgi:hypothetical protein
MPKRPSPRARRWKVAFWTLGWLMGAGFLATTLLRLPMAALAAAPLIVIPWARGTKTVLRATLGGAGFGLVAGFGIAMALHGDLTQAALRSAARSATQPASQPASQPAGAVAETRPVTSQPASQPTTQPTSRPTLDPETRREIEEGVRKAAAVFLPATMFACMASSALFSYLVRLRERRIEDEWLQQ